MGMIYTGSNQRIPEYHAWVCLCGGMKARSYVELGCGSAHFLREVGVEKIVTVDILPNGLVGTGIEHVQADSHDPQTLNRVLELLGDSPDVVFIDADHDAAAVRKDFELWYPVAQMAVGFHDILMPEIMLFWREIRLRHASIDIISHDIASADAWQHGRLDHSNGHVDCGGIGVLLK